MPRTPPRSGLVRRWERLPGAVQFALSFPVLTLALWWGHVALLNQPFWRGLFYGVFWGLVLSLALVYASTVEAARRRAGPGGQGDRAG